MANKVPSQKEVPTPNYFQTKNNLIVIEEETKSKLPILAIVAGWFVIFLLNLCFSNYGGFSAPLIEIHPFRQTQTASVTQNLYENGIDLFASEIDCVGSGKEQHLLLEMPIYQALVTLFYKLFGVWTGWGRIVSLIFLLIGSLSLYRVLRKLNADRSEATCISIIYLFFPINLIFSKAFLGDPMSVNLAIAATALSITDQSNSILHEISKILIVFGLLLISMLIKPFYAPFIYPLAVFALLKDKKYRAIIKFLILAALAFIPVVIFQIYTGIYNGEHGHTFFTLKNPAYVYWTFGDIAFRLTAENWFDRLILVLSGWYHRYLSWFFVVAPLIGIAYLTSKKKNPKTISYLAYGIIALTYWAIFFKMFNHGYYALVISPFLAIATYYFILLCADSLTLIFKLKRQWFTTLGVLFYLFICIAAFLRFSTITKKEKIPFIIAQKIEEFTDSDSNILLLTKKGDWSSTIPFYSKRKTLELEYSDRKSQRFQIFKRDWDKYQFVTIIKSEKEFDLDLVNPNGLIYESELCLIYEKKAQLDVD